MILVTSFKLQVSRRQFTFSILKLETRNLKLVRGKGRRQTDEHPPPHLIILFSADFNLLWFGPFLFGNGDF